MNPSETVLTNKQNIQRLQDFKEEAIQVHTKLRDDIETNSKDIVTVKSDLAKATENLIESIKQVEKIARRALYWSMASSLLLGGEMLDVNKEVILGILKEIAHNVVGTVFANF